MTTLSCFIAPSLRPGAATDEAAADITDEDDATTEDDATAEADASVLTEAVLIDTWL